MRGPDRTPKTAVEAYIAQLDIALSSLPADERREILLETRSHIAERIERDPSVAVKAVLEELGDPQAYAAEFLVRPPVENNTLLSVASVATGGWNSLPILMLVAAGYGLAALFIFIAVAKIVEPDATGWYVRTVADHRSVGLVLSDPNHGGRDVLGYWLVPIVLIPAGAIHWMLSRLLRRVARKSFSP